MIGRKKLTHLLLIGASSVLLFGCNNTGNDKLQDESTIEDTYDYEENSNEEGGNDNFEEDIEENIDDNTPSVEENPNEAETKESVDSQQTEGEQPNETSSIEDNEDLLSEYSSNEIEYARVWLSLGSNQEVDELNVQEITAGTAINPNDETSAVYPEDVIQLTGSRLVDGSVTYSGNGDGTINVYNVPTRWETNTPDELDESYMQEHTENIVEDTETIYVEPGNDNEVIQLIEIMNLN